MLTTSSSYAAALDNDDDNYIFAVCYFVDKSRSEVWEFTAEFQLSTNLSINSNKLMNFLN